MAYTLTKAKDGKYYGQHGSYHFVGMAVEGQIKVEAKRLSNDAGRFFAQSVAQAEKKMREFVKEANELYYAEVEQMRSQAQPVQVDACSHEWVSLSNSDTSNYSAHEQCSKCGKTHLIPRSN